ncbi:MAG: NapC/NirT family cytochrome c [Burkholderiaceae bacterium]|nr:NapC/NirT family cytochrome c [Burkholderiaceae bacterium]
MRSIRKLLRTLRSSPRPGTTVGRLVGVGIATTVVVALAAYALGLHPLLERTNTTEFCVSCHSMEATVYREYRTSVHYSNASGVRAGCPDCHVPKPLVPKLIAKVRAAKDVWHEILGTIDTPEKFEAHRWRMANAVWSMMERTDSMTCRSCHSWEAMNADEQDRSARSKHRAAQEEGRTCIECHKGLVHKRPKAPDAADL